MNTLLVAGATIAGLAIGGVLDPLGQSLAERSRADEQHRAAVEPSGGAAVEPSGGAVHEPSAGAAVEPSGAHLIRSGRSPGRTATSAVVTGALFGAAAIRFGAAVPLAPFCVFFALLVAVSMTDLSHRLVPRRLIYPAVFLIVPLLVASAAADHRWDRLVGAAIAGAVAFGVFFAIWWFVPRGMGFGDVRLSGVIGVTVGYLSILHAYLAFVGGFVIGLLFGIVLMAALASGRKTRIPFAPALGLGAVVAVLWGSPIAHGLFVSPR